MNTIILSIAARYLAIILILLSVMVLYRGHNLPGGGFIGGLMAAAGVLVHALANGWQVTSKAIRFDPLRIMVLGLLVAGGSGLCGMFAGEPFLTGLWGPTWYVPLLGKVKLGTPLLFDVGVYLTVIGFTLKCARAMGQQEDPTWTSSSPS